MSFSIVMLTYDNYEKFHRAIESMTKFLYMDEILEILILDNGSGGYMTSFLRKLEKSFSKIDVIFSSKNLGVAGGREILFKRARGDYILSFDSDIVMLDPLFLVNTIIRNLKPLPWEEGSETNDNGIFLLGGGGGRHPYFPSFLTEDVIVENNREEKNEFVIVDEVAGWCHCFRKALLQNVSMDTTFYPFWGEDSDFCVQIKKLGGRCAIFGKGVVAHKFSTCRDVSKQHDMRVQYEKLFKKWHPCEKFIDSEWYSVRYNTKTPIQDYLTGDIMMGRVAKEEDQDFDTENINMLIKKYIKPVTYSLDNTIHNTITLVHPDLVEDIDPRNPIVVILDSDQPQIVRNNCTVFRRQTNVSLHPYILLLMVIRLLSTENHKYISIFGYELSRANINYNRKGVRKLIRIEGCEHPEMIYTFDIKKMKNLLDSYPLMNIFKAALKIPREFLNEWCPEYSPRDILPELIVRLYECDEKCNMLTIVISDRDVQEEEIAKISKHSDIFAITVGEEIAKIPKGVQYYQQLEKVSIPSLFSFLGSSKPLFIYNYDVITILDNRIYDVDGSVDEFYHRSRYQNQIMVQDDLGMFSFKVLDLEKTEKLLTFLESKKNMLINGQKINIESSFLTNLPQKLELVHIWKKEEKDEIVTYSREDDRGSDLVDFPLILKR